MNSGTTAYDKDRAWSDRFVGQARYLCDMALTEIASREMDTKHATDLVRVGGNIGLRTRKCGKDYSNFKKWGNQFTIRADRPSGAKTELAKILDGDGDFNFYGWVDNDVIVYWTLYDLNVFREVLEVRPELQYRTKPLRDGVLFAYFNFTDFPADFIVYSNLPGLYQDNVANAIVFDKGAA